MMDRILRFIRDLKELKELTNSSIAAPLWSDESKSLRLNCSKDLKHDFKSNRCKRTGLIDTISMWSFFNFGNLITFGLSDVSLGSL